MKFKQKRHKLEPFIDVKEMFMKLDDYETHFG